MARALWGSLLWLIAAGFPWLLVRFHRGRELALVAFLAGIAYAAASVLVAPAGRPHHSAIAVSGLLALELCAWFAPTFLQRLLATPARTRRALCFLTCLAMTLFPLACAELVCRVLTDCRVLKYHQGIHTVSRAGPDDWRLATITGDEFREPDPVLLWRPVACNPYSSQRFKGPTATVPKPPGVCRVMCYGDSLTDGPPKGGWPTWLRRLLTWHPPDPTRRFEVLNAGVAGYSSHQGLRRFQQEVDQFDPDLVLVSFGWNDAATVNGRPDRSFQLPPWPLISCQRALVRYRLYLVLMYYARGARTAPPVAPGGVVRPRVGIEEYLANLDGFRTEALARGIPIVFLTRPHKIPGAELAKNSTWRGSVPRYNAALVDWAAKRNACLLDVQRYFETLSPALFADECHLTPEGYQRLGDLVLDRLVNGPAGLIRSAGPALTDAR
jgi:lysophospholipase L1-like esterase